MHPHLSSRDCLQMGNVRFVSAVSQCVPDPSQNVTVQILYLQTHTHRTDPGIWTPLCVCTGVSVCTPIGINYSFTTPARIHSIPYVQQCQVTPLHRERTQKTGQLCQSSWRHMGRHSHKRVVRGGYITRGNRMVQADTR